MMRHLIHALFLSSISISIGFAQDALPASADSAFGSSKKTKGAMLGIFYDLKQNQKRQPMPNVDHMKILAKFLDSGWDENVLSKYFRATKPLYATEVMIPTMSADGAPDAFGLKGVVKPSKWFVIYKAQVSPPTAGTYRFVGIADDVMAVAVNGKTSLVSHYGGWPNRSQWVEPSPRERIRVWAGQMKRGNWFTCKEGEIIDLDILIGEIPGNLFGAWLFIEKKGEVYPVSANPRYGNIPALPVFQLKKKSVPKSKDESKNIPFSISPTPWICHP